MALGGKLLGGLRIGSKFLGKAGRLGQKFAGGATRAFDAAAGLPIVGHAIGQSPLMQGMRGVVGGMQGVAKNVSAAGDVLEKGLSGQQSIADTGRRLAGHARSARGDFRAAQGGGRKAAGGARSLYHRARGMRGSFFRQGGGDTDLGTTRHS
jgi:hypothetical protein